MPELDLDGPVSLQDPFVQRLAEGAVRGADVRAQDLLAGPAEGLAGGQAEQAPGAEGAAPAPAAKGPESSERSPRGKGKPRRGGSA